MRRKLRLLAVLAVMGIFATGAYAFTAANNVPESSAGFGGNQIKGYVVSDIQYTLGVNYECESPDLPYDENNFGNCVTGVSFTLDGANEPSNVTVHFAVPDPANLSPHLYSTTNDDCEIENPGSAAPWTVRCNVKEFAASIETLRIAAAQ